MAKGNKNYYMENSIDDSGVASTQNPAIIDTEEVNRKLNTRLHKGGNAPYLVGVGRSFGNFITGENVGDILNANSKVDRNIKGDVLAQLEAGRDLNDIRYDTQSGWDRFGNSLVNFGVTTATTFISSLGGLIEGIGEAIATGEVNRLWNNTLNNAMVDIQNETKKNFMNYRGAEYENKSIWEKLGSGLFYADLFESMGFTSGMLAAAFVPGVGAAGVIGKGVSALGKLQGLSKMGNIAAQIGKIGGKAMTRLNSAIGEASIEAVNHKNDEIEGKTAIAEAEFNRMMANATSDEERASLQEQYQQTLQDIKNDAINGGNFVFLSNIAALTASNSIQWGHLLDKGFSSGLRNYSSGLKLLGDRTVTAGKKAAFVGKALGRKAIDGVAEGMEEVVQSAITDIPKNYANYNTFNNSIFNPEKRKTAANLIEAMGQGIAETLGDKRTAEEFASGLLMGIIGAPAFGAGKGKISKYVSWNNSAFQTVRDALNQYDRMSEVASRINDRIKDGKKFNASLNGLVRALDLNDAKGKALAAHDHKAFTDAQNAEFLNDIQMFEEAGMLDYLKQSVKDATSMSDEEVQKMIDETTSAEGNGPYTTDGNKMSIEDAKKSLQQRAKAFQEMIDYYGKSSEKLREQYPGMGDFARRSILYSKGQLETHKKRMKELSEDASSILREAGIKHTSQRDLINAVRAFGAERNAIFEAIDKSDNLTDDEKADVKEKLDDLKRLQLDASDIQQNINYLIKHPEIAEADFERAREEAEKEEAARVEAAKSEEEKAAELFRNRVSEAMPDEWDDDQKVAMFDTMNNIYAEASSRGIPLSQAIQEVMDSDEVDSITKQSLQQITEKMAALDKQRSTTTVEDDSTKAAREEAQEQQRQKETQNIKDVEESSDAATKLIKDNNIDEKVYSEELNSKRKVTNVAKAVRQDLSAINKLLKGDISDKQFLRIMGYSKEEVKKMSDDEIRNTATTLASNYHNMQQNGSKSVQQKRAAEEAAKQAETEKAKQKAATEQRRREDIEDAAEAKPVLLKDEETQRVVLIDQTPTTNSKKFNKGQKYYDNQLGRLVTIEEINEDGSMKLRLDEYQTMNVSRKYKALYALKSKKIFNSMEEAEDALQKIAEQKTGKDFSKEAYGLVEVKEEAPKQEALITNLDEEKQENSSKQKETSAAPITDNDGIQDGSNAPQTEENEINLEDEEEIKTPLSNGPNEEESSVKDNNQEDNIEKQEESDTPRQEEKKTAEVLKPIQGELFTEEELNGEVEEEKPIKVDTATSDTTDQGNKSPLSTEQAPRLPGNIMFPYDREKLENGVEEERTGAKANDSMSRFFRWMKNEGIQLQKIIDHELSKIIKVSPQLHIMRINPQNNTSDDAALGSYMALVVPYTDEVAKLHNDDYGGVVTSNGQQYLIVGTLGYRNSIKAENNSWSEINTKTNNQALKFFEDNPTERFFVSSDYTEVQSITSGRQIKQQIGEESASTRNVKEMLEDTNRNPGKLVASKLRFGIQTLKGFFTTKRDENGADDYTPRDSKSSIGEVFLMVPTASGAYMPCKLKPIALQDIDRNSDNKALQSIIGGIKNCIAGMATLNPNIRKAAIAELYKYLVLSPQSKNILTGTGQFQQITLTTADNANTVKIDIPMDVDTNEQSRNEFIETLTNAMWDYNFLFSFRIQDLSNSTKVNEFLEAGLLRTDYSQLATSGAEFFVYPIGKDGTPLKQVTTSNSTTNRSNSSDYSKAQAKLNTVYFQGKEYRYQNNKWVSGENFTEITDKKLIEQLDLAKWVRSLQRSADFNNATGDYFIVDSSKDNPTVIKRKTDGSFVLVKGETAQRSIDLINAKKAEQNRREKVKEAAETGTHQSQQQKKEEKKVEKPLTEAELLEQSEGKFGERKENSSMNEKNQEQKTPAQQEANKIVQKIQQDSSNIHLTEDEKHYEGPGGKLFARVTKIIEAVKGAIPFNESSAWKLPSTKLGTSLDNFVRDFFNNALGDLDSLSDRYRGYTQTTLRNLLKDLQDFKDSHSDLTFISRDVTVTGDIIVTDKNGRKMKVPVAGTLDLLAYDKDGNFHIFDMKTLHGEIDERKIKKWHNQLSLYKEFLQKKYGVKVVETSIIPFKITYTNPKGWIEQLDDKSRVSRDLLEAPTTEYTEKDGNLYADGVEWRESTAQQQAKVNITTTPIRVEHDLLDESARQVMTPLNDEQGNYSNRENKVDTESNSKEDTSNRSEFSLQSHMEDTDKFNSILNVIDELGYQGDYSSQDITDFIKNGGIDIDNINNFESWLDNLKNCFGR